MLFSYLICRVLAPFKQRSLWTSFDARTKGKQANNGFFNLGSGHGSVPSAVISGQKKGQERSISDTKRRERPGRPGKPSYGVVLIHPTRPQSPILFLPFGDTSEGKRKARGLARSGNSGASQFILCNFYSFFSAGRGSPRGEHPPRNRTCAFQRIRLDLRDH